MLVTPDVFKDLLGTIALMALLAIAYGTIMRASMHAWLGRLLLGGMFGGAAIMAMHDPIHVAEGVIGDLRIVPLLLAGAFLGPQGAAISMAMALGARFEIGGAGTASGCFGIVIGALVGLAWAGWLRERQPSLWAIVGLAALSTSTVLSVALMPSAVIGTFLFNVWPFLLPLQVVGVIIVGAVLARERRLVGVEQRLIDMAKQDPLTGLLNRRGFEASVPLLSGSNETAGLLMIDLDHFKRVNDQHGHAAGDEVLKEACLRVASCCRPNDLVSRFGGEELVVYLPGLTARQTKDVGQRICNLIRSDIFVVPSGATLILTASVGCTTAVTPIDLDSLLDQADAALYAAKAAGRDRCQFVGESGQTGGNSPKARNLETKTLDRTGLAEV